MELDYIGTRSSLSFTPTGGVFVTQAQRCRQASLLDTQVVKVVVPDVLSCFIVPAVALSRLGKREILEACLPGIALSPGIDAVADDP